MIREGAVYIAQRERARNGRIMDGWRRVVGVDKPHGYVAFVGQSNTERVRFIKAGSFKRWVKKSANAD